MAKVGSRDCPREEGDVIVYQSQSDDHGDAELSTRILLALDEVPGYDLENSETVLFEHVDLDALDELFGRANGTARESMVTFPVDDYTVTATGAGAVTVSRAAQTND